MSPHPCLQVLMMVRTGGYILSSLLLVVLSIDRSHSQELCILYSGEQWNKGNNASFHSLLQANCDPGPAAVSQLVSTEDEGQKNGNKSQSFRTCF